MKEGFRDTVAQAGEQARSLFQREPLGFDL